MEPGRRRSRSLCLFLCCTAALAASGDSAAAPLERATPSAPATSRLPSLYAVFTRRSYAAGELATLRLRTDARALSMRILRAGAERAWGSVGKPWGPATAVRWSHPGVTADLRLRVPALPSSLYFVRLTTRTGRATYAPLLVRPSVPGVRAASPVRVAVILPTNTWQAYNRWDADGNRRGDTWYADGRLRSVALGRPYIDNGKPPHYRSYDRGFLRFLVHSGHAPDYFGDEDFDRFTSGEQLAGLYDLIVFAGHHEYQSTRSFDLAERYRDLGGNLAFLSANNFFWRVDPSAGGPARIWRIKKFRDLGRPEARLIGVQYRANDRGQRIAPYTVVNRGAGAWLFAGLPAADNTPLSDARYGIEFDMTTPDSPPGTTVLAEVNPALTDPTIRGHMSYYETAAGAKVFAAGTLSFGGSDNPVGLLLFTNLWAQLARP